MDVSSWESSGPRTTRAGSGFNNTIIVSNQAQVVSKQNLIVGSNDANTSSNALVRVSDEGTTVRTERSVLVGFTKPDNQLILEKGAVVLPAIGGGYPNGLHMGRSAGSDRNLILICESGAIRLI